jgi:hypothetical protein
MYEPKHYYEQLLKNAYRRGYDPPQEQILLSIQGQNIGSMQNYIIISGLPKSGKSTFTTSIVATGLNTFDIWGMKLQCLPDRPKICYIDTESSEYDFYKHMGRIKSIANLRELPLFFDSYCLRKEEPESIKNMVTAYLSFTPNCSIIVIDGLLDICLNYNDEIECRKVVTWLKEICTINNILLIGILHTGKNEGKTLGHLGSNTDRWAQSTLSVKKTETGTFILEPKFLRSSAGFKPIEIEYNTEQNKFVKISNNENFADKKNKHFTEYTTDQHNLICNNIFNIASLFTYENLVYQISVIDKRGINQSKTYLKFLKENNYINKDKNNMYYDIRKPF